MVTSYLIRCQTGSQCNAFGQGWKKQWFFKLEICFTANVMLSARGGKKQWFFKLEICFFWFFGFYYVFLMFFCFLGLSLESQK